MRPVLVLAAATAVLAAAVAPSASPRAPLLITEAESGSVLVVKRPRQIFLRLDHRWRWSSPRVYGSAVRLNRVRYESDPGYDEWHVRLVGTGRATVTSAGEPNCAACDRLPRRFRVAITVRS
jgi:hypothetical protein